ncbi:MAG: ATP-binding protein [Bacteroidales bacterium]|nr:ATP-binding protein [Bacteroidales bacterium]
MLLIYRRRNKQLAINNHLLNTELTQSRNELNLKSESIDIKINEKTKELQEHIEARKSVELERKIALKKAEESNFLRNTFLSSMSREIRTPISGIIGFSNMLLGEIDQQEKPELHKMAKGISESSNQLLGLMGHILDLSRIEAKDYELKVDTFEVNTVINNCIEKIKNQALKKGLNLEFGQFDNYFASGDKDAFEKSVDLILDNAVKYTSKGKIKIDLQADTNQNKLKVLVSDTGIGIDKSFLSDIFEAFRQDGTGYSKIQQGAGLGLPLAHNLLHLMDGELQIESERNKGTIVTFTLLRSFENQEKGELETAIGIPLKKTAFFIENQPSIFIVEDDKMNRLIFEKMLKKYAKVKIAVDGVDGFKKLETTFQSKDGFDIILLDINLPAPWDGMLLLKEFKKKWPELNKIPFVAQTAYAMPGDKEKFLAAGFDDYISKPIDKKELFTIIENNMRKFGTLKKLSYEK